MDEAIPWFAKAATLDPNQTGAFRYWGDALMKQGKMAEARDTFSQGDPRRTLLPSRAGSASGQWARINKVPLTHPRIMPPDPKPGEARAVSIEDGTTSLAVLRCRASRLERRLCSSRNIPKEPAYRHSLEEESEALHAMVADIAKDAAAGKIKDLHPTLVNLVTLDKEGLIEAYVLFAQARRRDLEGLCGLSRESTATSCWNTWAGTWLPLPEKVQVMGNGDGEGAPQDFGTCRIFGVLHKPGAQATISDSLAVAFAPGSCSEPERSWVAVNPLGDRAARTDNELTRGCHLVGTADPCYKTARTGPLGLARRRCAPVWLWQDAGDRPSLF